MFGIDQQVQQTADAYRGKPDMLQQKYAQNQQLIDLLALQKLKSDKEEASRQMALQMGSQGKPPTIADQRESQVLDMTKKEVVDQQAGIMQNKMQQQQAAQQKLLQSAGAPQMPAQAAPQPQPQQPPSQGLAGLPAPNIQGMAGGGIVAFDGGGSTDKEKEQREKDRAAVTNTIEQLLAAGKDVLSAPGRGVAGAAESVITRPLRAAGVPVPYLPESFYGGDRGSLTPYADKLARDNAANQAIDASRRLPADEATPAYAGAVARQAEARDQAQPPAPAPQAAPQGTGGGAPMGNAPGTVGFGIQSLIGTKTPEEAARENEARAAAAANFTPEDAATKRQDNQEKANAADRDKLARALMAMYGQTSNYGAIAAGGAQAANDADQAMRERHRGNDEFINVGLASRIAGTKAGESRFKDVLAGMSQGVDAAVKQSANATAAASNALRQKELDFNHAMQRINDFTRTQEKGLADLDKNYTNAKARLGILPGTKIAPGLQRELDILDTQYALGRERLQKTPPEVNVLRQRIGMGSYDGYSIVGVQPAAPKS
jgi:hypothetical protein